MRLTALFMVVMAALALFAGSGDAAPQPAKINFKGLAKAGKTLQKVLGAVGAAATAHDLIGQAKNKMQQG